MEAALQMRHHAFRIVLAAGAALSGAYMLAAAPVDPQGISRPAAAVPAASAPLPGGPAPDLDLVFTSQVIGWIEPCG